jgi:hypothetical protein
MKSSFFFSLVVAILVLPVWAQTTSTNSTEVPQKGSFDKFYERLKIGYFGAYSGSSLGHWDEKAQDESGVRSSGYAHNLWNQLSFNYNFGARMNFVVNPRWTLNTGSTSGHGPNNTGLLALEDALVGFQGTFSSTDKKLNLWTRPGIRLPTSRSSRQNDITTQPEVLSNLTYDFDKTWQLGVFQQVRHWAYENRFTAFRYRLYHSPYVQYSVNDKNRLALWYEHYFENRSNLKSQNNKNHRLQDYWQNAMLSWSHDVSPKFNVMPFIGYVLDTSYATKRPLEPAWLGAWISYQIK